LDLGRLPDGVHRTHSAWCGVPVRRAGALISRGHPRAQGLDTGQGRGSRGLRVAVLYRVPS